MNKNIRVFVNEKSEKSNEWFEVIVSLHFTNKLVSLLECEQIKLYCKKTGLQIKGLSTNFKLCAN
jgi:hypothetical protein